MSRQFSSRINIAMIAIMLLLACISLSFVPANGQSYKCIIDITSKYVMGQDFVNWCIMCVLAVVTFIDIKIRKIPNACILSLIGLWLIRLVFQSATVENNLVKYQIISNMLTAVVMAAAFLFAGWLTNKIVKKQSLGGGDIKLVFAAGLILDPSKSMIMVLAACVLALVTFIIIWIKDKDEYFPFGPAISIATGIMILCT